MNNMYFYDKTGNRHTIPISQTNKNVWKMDPNQRQMTPREAEKYAAKAGLTKVKPKQF